jgi:uncharacterized protein (UPF0210 family)
MQEEVRTSTNAYQEKMDTTQERMGIQISSLFSRMEADRKSNREEIRAGQEQVASFVSRIEVNQAKTDVNLNEIREEEEEEKEEEEGDVSRQ